MFHIPWDFLWSWALLHTQQWSDIFSILYLKVIFLIPTFSWMPYFKMFFYCSSREWLRQRNIRGDSPLSWDFSSCSTKPDEEKNNANFFFPCFHSNKHIDFSVTQELCSLLYFKFNQAVINWELQGLLIQYFLWEDFWMYTDLSKTFVSLLEEMFALFINGFLSSFEWTPLELRYIINWRHISFAS